MCRFMSILILASVIMDVIVCFIQLFKSNLLSFHSIFLLTLPLKHIFSGISISLPLSVRNFDLDDCILRIHEKAFGLWRGPFNFYVFFLLHI